MSPNPSPQGGVRSAAAVNADIRALVVASGGYLCGDARRRYEQLVAEWTVACAAERVEVVEVA